MQIPTKLKNPKPWLATISAIGIYFHQYLNITIPPWLLGLACLFAVIWGIWLNPDSILNVKGDDLK